MHLNLKLIVITCLTLVSTRAIENVNIVVNSTVFSLRICEIVHIDEGLYRFISIRKVRMVG